jgi:hypothetical protein
VERAGHDQPRLPKLNLLPNTYQVIVWFYEHGTPTPLVAVQKQLYFHITSDGQQNGAVHLDHEWALKNGGSK